MSTNESFLDQLYFGRLQPWEEIVEAPDQVELQKKLADLEDQLITLLSDEAGKVYAELVDVRSELGILSKQDLFKKAFRLGMACYQDTLGHPEEE